MGTTTIIKINNPKICGSCGFDQLKYTTEDYGGIRDTFWECSCGWEDVGATFSAELNISKAEVSADKTSDIPIFFSLLNKPKQILPYLLK